MVVSCNAVSLPRSSIFEGFSILNQPFGGTPILGNLQMATIGLKWSRLVPAVSAPHSTPAATSRLHRCPGLKSCCRPCLLTRCFLFLPMAMATIFFWVPNGPSYATKLIERGYVSNSKWYYIKYLTLPKWESTHRMEGNMALKQPLKQPLNFSNGPSLCPQCDGLPMVQLTHFLDFLGTVRSC